MTEQQKAFFETLKVMQEEVVYANLASHNHDTVNENVLFDVTYDTIYRLMEFIDGYYGTLPCKLDLIDTNSQESLKTGIELHDACASYLRFGV